MIITIDGPAGAGKSTVSKALAEHLQYRYLDTGAMYRAVTLVVHESGEDPIVVAGATDWMSRLLDPALRSAEVDAGVAAVARLPEVRALLRAQQRLSLALGDTVAEGRDIGSVVWPEAELKVWLDALPEERRRRRAAERGEQAGVVALERDRHDAAQMIVPPDSVRIETDGLSVDQIVNSIVAMVRERV